MATMLIIVTMVIFGMLFAAMAVTPMLAEDFEAKVVASRKAAASATVERRPAALKVVLATMEQADAAA